MVDRSLEDEEEPSHLVLDFAKRWRAVHSHWRTPPRPLPPASLVAAAEQWHRERRAIQHARARAEQASRAPATRRIEHTATPGLRSKRVSMTSAAIREATRRQFNHSSPNAPPPVARSISLDGMLSSEHRPLFPLQDEDEDDNGDEDDEDEDEEEDDDDENGEGVRRLPPASPRSRDRPATLLEAEHPLSPQHPLPPQHPLSPRSSFDGQRRPSVGFDSDPGSPPRGRSTSEPVSPRSPAGTRRVRCALGGDTRYVLMPRAVSFAEAVELIRAKFELPPTPAAPSSALGSGGPRTPETSRAAASEPEPAAEYIVQCVDPSHGGTGALITLTCDADWNYMVRQHGENLALALAPRGATQQGTPSGGAAELASPAPRTRSRPLARWPTCSRWPSTSRCSPAPPPCPLRKPSRCRTLWARPRRKGGGRGAQWAPRSAPTP